MKKRWFSLLLAAVMVLSLLPAGVLAADAADLKYTIADGAVTITGCDSARGELVIPSTIEGKPVRAIGASAFDRCAYLTSVVLPEGLTGIGSRAFASCERMESVNLPTTLRSIGTGAFLSCVSLKHITLPEGLKTLPPYAFSVCEGLEAVTIPDGVTSIEHEAFYGCSGLKKMTIPSSVSTVETQAFSACRKLAEVEIRSTATKFEDDALSNCANLKHVFYAGTEQQWKAAGGEFVGLGSRVFLHYGVGESRGHIQTLHFDPTPAQPGYDAWSCSCGFSQLTSSVVYVGADGMTAAISDRTDLQFAGAAIEPASEEQEAALRSQSGRNVLHVFRAAFSEAGAALPVEHAVIELPVPEDVFPDSIRAFTIAQEITEVRAVLSADRTTITLTVDTPCDFCIAGSSNAHVHQLTPVARMEPTCTEPGAEAYWRCTECGMLFADAEGAEEIAAPAEIPAKGHHFELKNAKEATCAEPGYTGDRICSECGKVGAVGEEIAPRAHETEVKNAKAATCAEPGYTGDEICKNCGKVVSTGEVIPMLAHEAERRNAAEPTCTREGYTGDEICKNCGKVVSMGETIPALGHKPELQNAKKAACTEPGYTGDEVCAVCGEMLTKGEVIPATGHSWGEWAVTKPATEDAEGVETRACTACGAVETRAIPKVIPPEPENPFRDVSEGAYYYEPVLWAVNHEPQITNGTSENLFSPKATCTRGQVVTFLWRAMGCPEPASTTNPFADVKPGDYFYKAVLWAVEKGITNGVNASHFDPEGSCTRAHVVTFLWRAHEKPAATGSNPFVDVPAGQYYTDAVLWAVSQGITNGVDGTHFGPKEPCTRGQIVTFLYRDFGD